MNPKIVFVDGFTNHCSTRLFQWQKQQQQQQQQQQQMMALSIGKHPCHIGKQVPFEQLTSKISLVETVDTKDYPITETNSQFLAPENRPNPIGK